jgi:hypothetical protein
MSTDETEITRLREALAAETRARETAEVRVHDLNVVVDNWRGLKADAEATNTTLRAELAKAREPLKIAPKDGTSVLVWCRLQKDWVVARWWAFNECWARLEGGAEVFPAIFYPLPDLAALTSISDGAPKQEEG